jgi:hypothetical protein
MKGQTGHRVRPSRAPGAVLGSRLRADRHRPVRRFRQDQHRASTGEAGDRPPGRADREIPEGVPIGVDHRQGGAEHVIGVTTSGPGRPARSANCRCQRSNVDGVTIKTAHRSRGRSLASEASSIRSAGVYRGRGTCRRSTASWCRSTAPGTGPAVPAPAAYGCPAVCGWLSWMWKAGCRSATARSSSVEGLAQTPR